MIHYLLLVFAVICFTAQFALTKSYEKAVTPTFFAAVTMVFVTNLVGAALFWILCGFRVHVSEVSLLWALILAGIMIPYFVIGVRVLSLGSLAIYSMFMMLGGMLIPFLYGLLFLNEELTPGRLAGTILLSVFIVLQALWKNPTRDRMPCPGEKGGFFILCLVSFLINGMTGVAAKNHEIHPLAVDEMSFTVLSCAFTAAGSLALLLFGGKQSCSALRQTLRPGPLLIAVLLGCAAYTGSFLHLRAAEFVPASVQFPMVSGGVIVLSALVSTFVFREKAGAKEWICVGGAFFATVFFAF